MQKLIVYNIFLLGFKLYVYIDTFVHSLVVGYQFRSHIIQKKNWTGTLIFIDWKPYYSYVFFGKFRPEPKKKLHLVDYWSNFYIFENIINRGKIAFKVQTRHQHSAKKIKRFFFPVCTWNLSSYSAITFVFCECLRLV